MCPRPSALEAGGTGEQGAWLRLLELLVWGATYNVQSVVQECELALWPLLDETNACTILRVAAHHGYVCCHRRRALPRTLAPILGFNPYHSTN